MQSYALVKIEKPFLWLRFGKIGPYDKFTALLFDFQNEFPLATWDSEHRAWCLLANDLNKVMDFCKKQKLSLAPMYSNNTINKKQGQQAELPFPR